MHHRITITSSLGALIALVFAALPASAATITWNFNTPSGPLGTTQAYTAGGITVIAHGFDASNKPAQLFGKNLGGDEGGLGLAGDPSGEDEIAVGAGYVQLDITNVLTSGLVNGMGLIDSVQPGESYDIWGSNTLGSLGSLLITNGTLDKTFFALPDFGTFNFYSVTATSGNVLLGAASSGTPEPGTMALLAVALMVAAPFVMRRRDDSLVS